MLNWVDFTILGIIAISTLISLVRGFVKEAISLVVWFGALFIASQFFADLAVHYTLIEDPVLRNGAAIATLFVMALIVGGMVNHVVGRAVQASGLSGADRILGAVFGGLRGLLIVSALLFFLDTFTAAATALWWQQSILVPEFGIIIEWFFTFVKGSSSFLTPA
mgnify:CR=1 FL=1